MSAIFLSHSSRDNEVAARVKAWLETQGHRSVFLDFDPERGIPAGRTWERELYQQLRACRIAHRNLTLAEWNQFIGPAEERRPTCPGNASTDGSP